LKEFEGGPEELQKWNLPKDQRIIYAIRSFPYPDYQLDMINCISKARDSTQEFVIVEDDLTLEPENRFIEEFNSKNINEEGNDFSESAKFEDYARYFQQVSLIYRFIKKDVLEKLGKKNTSNAIKLEQDGNNILN